MRVGVRRGRWIASNPIVIPVSSKRPTEPHPAMEMPASSSFRACRGVPLRLRSPRDRSSEHPLIACGAAMGRSAWLSYGCGASRFDGERVEKAGVGKNFLDTARNDGWGPGLGVTDDASSVRHRGSSRRAPASRSRSPRQSLSDRARGPGGGPRCSGRPLRRVGPSRNPHRQRRRQPALAGRRGRPRCR